MAAPPLSPLAQRVLACMLAVPEGIRFTGSDLEDILPEGQYQIRKALRELDVAGHRTVKRLKRANGQFYTEVTYSATPRPAGD